MILEHVLDKQFSNTSSEIFSNKTDWNEYIEIAHVHGKFDGMDKDIYNPYDLVLEWANSLAVIHETVCSEEVEVERSKAQEIMLTSNKIYATGFAFSQSNVEIIKILEPDRRRGPIKIYYSNFKGDYGLKTAMDNYQSPKRLKHVRGGKSYSIGIETIESPGTDSRPMSTVSWFYSGVPGRLPS